MNTALPTRKLATLLLGVFLYINTATAGIEPIPAGSFIINMGVVPQTYGNGIKPYGMIWTLIRNYKVPIKWIINPNKIKDGADFTYNSVDYKGGTFIIHKKYRTAKVDSTILSWQSQGVVGVTTSTDFSADVTYTIKYNPLWTFDFQNGKIAQNYLTEAGIPITGYPMKDPNGLNSCDDLFVMPHADPTWGTHQNLLFWNKNNRGWLWYGCHAASVIEETLNPVDSSQQMNFLSTTGLINFGDHDNATPPYSYRFPADPEMQFMGTMDAAVTNGSEQVYLPRAGGGWRPTTRVAVWDPTAPDVPSLSSGEAAIVAYGRAFGDSALGKVMFQAGHSFDKGNSAAVAAIRAFFNFSYMSVLDKIVTPEIQGPITLSGTGAGKYPFTANLPQGYFAADYTFHWSANVPGTFSNEFGASTFFTPAGVASYSTCTIMVTITDGCGREYYQTIDFGVGPVPPVALDRTAKSIINSPGTGAQAIGIVTPLAGSDSDGYVINYVIKSLPSNGVLYYANNSNSPDIAINSIPAGGLILSGLKMKTLKFDPVDNFGGTTSFQYTVEDNTNLFSNNTATYTIPVNPPPVTQNFICKPVFSNADVTPVCPMVATDNNSIASYTIVSLPPTTKCEVYLYKVAVTEGQVLTPAQATQLTFKPSGSYLGYAEILYTATDNDGASDETPSTITLQMVNQAPVVKDISATVINDPTGAIQIAIPALSATDPDGTIASYLITNAPASTQGILYYNNNGTYLSVTDNQVLTLSQASSLKFDPVDNYTGVAKFKYTATDNGNLTAPVPAVFSIPVKAVTPSANNIMNTSVYSGAVMVGIKPLAAQDNDSTDVITSFIIKQIPSSTSGTLYYNNGGIYTACTNGIELTTTQGTSLKFQPVAGFTGNAKFTYTAKDDEGLTDPTAATFTIPVSNSSPSAKNVKTANIYDTTGIVVIDPLEATDNDGTIIKYLITTLPDASTGILKLNGVAVTTGQEILPANAGSLQFSPVLHNSRDAVFKFTAIDNLGAADPTAASYTIPISFIPYKKLPKADSKTTTKVSQKYNKSILPVSGSDSDGVVTSYKITKLRSSEGTLYIQGTPVTQNQVISASAADKLTFSPATSFTGTTYFNYVAIDDDGLSSAEAVYNIPVENITPVANNFTTATIKKGTTVVLPGLSATDEDGTISSYKILSLPTKGLLQFDSTGAGVWKNVSGLKELTPLQASKIRIIADNAAVSTSFTFSAKDNLGDTSNVAYYEIPVSLIAENQRPIVYNVTTAFIAMNAEQTLISPLSAFDPDGSVLAYVIQSIPPPYQGTIYYDSSGYWSVLRGVLTISPLQATTLKFKPSGIYAGNVIFTFKAIDILNTYSEQEAVFTIPVTNTITVSNITNSSVTNNTTALLSPLAATGVFTKYIIIELPDPSTGTLVMDGTPLKENQEIPIMNAGRLEFKPALDFKGNTTFKYTAADNLGNVDNTPATFTIPVTDQLPFAHNKTSQVITNYIGTAVQDIPALTATDNDGSISGFTIKSLPSGGKLYKNGTLISNITGDGLSISTAQAAQLSFDPDDNFGGMATFTYTAKDNSNNVSNIATYLIPVNTPPVTNNLSSTPMYVGQLQTSITSLAGTDDGSVSFFSILSLPSTSKGVLYVNNVAVTDLSQVDTVTAAMASQLSFQTLSAFDGTIFTYTATDNTGLIDVTPAVYTIPPSNFSMLNPLPLELLSFSGYKSSADNILYWSMNQEINSDHFEIERSLNGTSYNNIGSIKAAGNTSTKTNYSYSDKNVTTGINYYRIKLVDKDGSYQYSKAIALKRNSNAVAAMKILTNPFQDKLVIDLMVVNEGKTTLTLYDLKGRTIKKMELNTPRGMNHIELEGLSNISSAIYMLNISNNDGKSSTQLYKSN